MLLDSFYAMRACASLSRYWLVNRFESSVRARPGSSSEYSDGRFEALESDSEEETSRLLCSRTLRALFGDSGVQEVTRTPETPNTTGTIHLSHTPLSLKLLPSALLATSSMANTSTLQLSHGPPTISLLLHRRTQSTATRKSSCG